MSIGGADTALMVWSHGTVGDRACARGDSDDSDTDSEEEGGKDWGTGCSSLGMVFLTYLLSCTFVTLILILQNVILIILLSIYHLF